MRWCFFQPKEGRKHTVNQGEWYLKHPKKRSDEVFSSYRQLEDLWSQVCALALAKLVGIAVPEVYMMIPVFWDKKFSDDTQHSRITASLFSRKLNEFTELSCIYNQLLKSKSPVELYHQPELYLALLSQNQKFALGQLLATALWLGHWDLANNIDFANAGFCSLDEKNKVLPVLVDGGNALDEGFHGYTKLTTINLFGEQHKENRKNDKIQDFDAHRCGYAHLSPLNEHVYPLLPRFLFDQIKFFWTDTRVIDGFIHQANVIGAVKSMDITETIRQCWRHVVDSDGIHQSQPCYVLKEALQKTNSRWGGKSAGKSIQDVLLHRAKDLTSLAHKICALKHKGPEAIASVLMDQGRKCHI